ncbi:myotubularin related protein 15 [Cavenderia fasciculata]|uniref:Fanconi-associated nuclease n=1 Tax=Cavenderia fasciculata TaxID=261658 RepID=F4Q432_CACFS|nr:myotubularin related protein 15 [Cavenderia fasciculata]EGG16946.1 myotubularin related protein 15 [Cavenderia fasciculata]|eukprot:XP_004355420.1 myotubularin related protein 15 [Cavenderia fasciculata]
MKRNTTTAKTKPSTKPPTKQSSAALDKYNNDHKHLSNKTFPSFTGRQSSMLEFFPSKKQETQVNHITQVTEHDDGNGNKISMTTTTTTTTVSTVVSQVLKTPSPSHSSSIQIIDDCHSNSNTSPSPRLSSSSQTKTPPSSQQQQQQSQQSQSYSPVNSQGDNNNNSSGKRKKTPLGSSDIINNSHLVIINLTDDNDEEKENEKQKNTTATANTTTTTTDEMERFQKRMKNQTDKLMMMEDGNDSNGSISSGQFATMPICVSIDDDEEDENDGVTRTKEPQEVTLSQYVDNDPKRTKYYVNDFRLVTETVLERDVHLLSDKEVEAVNRFVYTLTSDSQHLFVRLYNRKGPWFQIQNILYPEINNIDDCIDELIDCGLLERYDGTTNHHDWRELTPLLPVDRLKRLLGASCPSGATKPRLIELVNKMDSGPTNSNGSPFFKNLNNFNKTKRSVEDSLGKCIQIKRMVVQVFRMIHHLFFFSWTTHNSTTMIVHNILGIRYPEYRLSKDKNGIFKTRQELIEYEECRQLEERIEFIFENGEEDSLSSILETCTEKLSPLVKLQYVYSFALKFTPGWVYTKVLSAGVGILERMKKYDDANYFYMFLLDSPFCSGKRGDWWLRLVINSKHQGQKENALIICERALQDCLVKTGDRLALEQQYLKLTKTCKKDIKPGLLKLLENLKQPSVVTIYYEKESHGRSGVKSQFYLSDGSLGKVEDAALDYYKNEEGMEGIHCETGIFIEFFMFFFWDIIFCSDIPHVFQSPYQDSPLDFGSEEFYFSRKDLITNKLEQLKISSNQDRRDHLQMIWSKNENCNVRGISWERYSLSQLMELSDSFGGGLIAYICKLMSEDFSSFSSGAPDLFLWKNNNNDNDNNNNNNNNSYTIKFCEVKGEGDRLAAHQKIWIDVLLSYGCQVDNCLVKNK